jgi:hypothetical protein
MHTQELVDGTLKGLVARPWMSDLTAVIELSGCDF